MTERPILFSGDMVKAILDGRKSQTRRVLRKQPPTVEAVKALAGTGYHWHLGQNGKWRAIGPVWAVRQLMHLATPTIAPPYAVGDLLYVREAHYLTDDGHEEYAVFANDQEATAKHLANMRRSYGIPEAIRARHSRLRPSIHMPKWAARIWLEVTDVRVQRLRDVTEEVARAEGFSEQYEPEHPDTPYMSAKQAFLAYMQSAHKGKDVGTWVAAYTFKRIEKPS